MSLALLRDGPLSGRRSDRAASLRKRTSQLRALNAITTTITQNCGLPPSLDIDFDATLSPPLTPAEVRFLDENDIEKGRYFQDSSLPVTFESIESISPFKRLPEPESTNPAQHTDVQVHGIPLIDNNVSIGGPEVKAEVKPAPPLTEDAKLTGIFKRKISNIESGPLRPSDVARKHPDHHAKTVHLPPKEVQEERLRLRRQSRDEIQRAAQLREAETHVGEPTSSPSSTAGAWSTATPLPADPSPLTSVGEDMGALDRLEKKPEDEQVLLSHQSAQKQEHDRLLEAQKEAARREILGSEVASPDVQLRLEQEQAAKNSRDAAAVADAPAAVHAPLETAKEETLFEDPPELLKRAANIATAPAQNSSNISLCTEADVKPQAPADPTLEPSQESTQPRTCTPTVVQPTTTASVNTPVQGRMTTRVSSGTMRQKSVSEIIGKTPRLSFSTTKQPPVQAPSSIAKSPKSKASVSSAERQARSPNDHSLQQTANQSQRHFDLPVHNEGYEALRGAAEDQTRDYLEPLFKMQTYENLPLNKTLTELLARANKVVNTSDHSAGIHERQDHRILRRIYGLQNANKWSLRQMQPRPELTPPKTHIDYLLSEMKWMRTDFRQERKMKLASAKFFAEQCVVWVNSDPETRLSMQVKVTTIEIAKPESDAPHSPAETNFGNGEQHIQDAKSPPELESANEHDDSSVEDLDMPKTPQYTIVPSSIFSAMNIDKDTIHLRDSEQFHTAVDELPLYAPFDDEPPLPTQTAIQSRPVPLVSKFCEGKIMTQIPLPARKRSRFDYEEEDATLKRDVVTKRPRAKDGTGMPPEQRDIALFDPENKLLRDRLHSNTAFRPPSEFPMPSSQFYEFRTASQWITEDDQLLRRLAKDYSFNWSLIADEMSLPSKLSGAADRRTPWECFERWVELESLPNEMRKTLYFKTWNQRIEAAQRNNDMRYQAQLQAQAQTPGPPQNISRRRTQPVKVDKRRTISRYLHVVDAMRKNARKREQHAHKQAEAQKAASLRKQNENSAPKSSMHTPAEFSKLRHDRDVQIAQRQEQYRQQMLERSRQAALQQRNGPYVGQQGATGQQRPPNAPQMQTGHPRQGANTQMQHPNTAQQGQMAPQRSAHLAVPQMGMQGNIPQAQMQPNARGNAPNNHGSSDNMQQQRMVLQEAQRQAQMKQAQMNGQQYQMPPPNHVNQAPKGAMNVPQNQMGSGSIPHGNNSHTPVSNGHLMPQNHNAHQSNGTASASPHMPPPPNPAASSQQQPQQLSSGHVPAISQITHQLQAKHPGYSAEQIQTMTSEHLKHFYTHQARTNAMQAAAGISASPNTQNTYNQNQSAFQQNNMTPTNGQPPYSGSPVSSAPAPRQDPNVQNYNRTMQAQILQRQDQLRVAAMQGSNGSPRIAQASPNMQHASPNMAQAVPNMNGTPQPNARTPTPQMARLGSSGGAPGSGTSQPQGAPMASPGIAQGSPRAVPAGVSQRQ